MGWSLGFDERWQRDVGYGVPAWCDHPDCTRKIDRGLAYVCGGQPFGGEHGCGLYFCDHHRGWRDMPDDDDSFEACERCEVNAEPFEAKPDHPEWMEHKLTHDSWHQWRMLFPKKTKALRAALAASREQGSEPR